MNTRTPYYSVIGLPKGQFISFPDRPLQAEVQCLVRSLMNTPNGPAFLHLYRNNVDDKEHLALVFDSAQLEQSSDGRGIRSASLDSAWSSEETEMDRLVRGAYAGRLAPGNKQPSVPSPEANSHSEPTLVRIHSQCYTGENLHNDRCDCRQQVDDAIRVLGAPDLSGKHTRGVFVYLMQEGRGIGLLSKLRAYNIQDCGHTDDQANVMLGHKEDERSYAVAAAILRDLGIADSVRMLTGNQEKVAGARKEGINVVEVVPF